MGKYVCYMRKYVCYMRKNVRQMHNYVDLNYSDSISTPADEHDYKSNKIPESLTVEQLQQQRDADITKITGNRPPPI